MNLSQLKYAKSVAETGSFSRASEQCFVTQPSLSNAIAQLEDELGGRLFFRTTHNVSVTPFGERLLPLIIGVLDAQSELEKAAKNLLEPEQKLIRIGFCPLVNIRFVNSVLETFRKSNPNVEIILKESFIDDLRQKLSENKLDVLFVPQSFEMKHAVKTAFYTEDLCFLPKGTESVSDEKVCIEQIAEEPFTIAGEGCGLVFALREMFDSKGFVFKEYAGQALNYSVLEDWAALGIGATILPLSKISKGNKTHSKLFIEDGKAANITFQTVWNKHSPQGSHLKDFLQYFKKIAPKYLKGLSI